MTNVISAFDQDYTGDIIDEHNYSGDRFIQKQWPEPFQPNDFKLTFGLSESKHDPLAEVQKLIADTCDEIKKLLLEKNRKYGNSALEPSRIFSRADPIEQIKVRIDDKLTRLRNAQGDEDEDVVQDLMGYLVLLRVAQKLKVDVV